MSRLHFMDVWWLYGVGAIVAGIVRNEPHDAELGVLALIMWGSMLTHVKR